MLVYPAGAEAHATIILSRLGHVNVIVAGQDQLIAKNVTCCVCNRCVQRSLAMGP